MTACLGGTLLFSHAIILAINPSMHKHSSHSRALKYMSRDSKICNYVSLRISATGFNYSWGKAHCSFWSPICSFKATNQTVILYMPQTTDQTVFSLAWMGANRTHSRVEQNHRPTAIRHRAAGSAAFIWWLPYKVSHSAKVWMTHFGDQPRINNKKTVPKCIHWSIALLITKSEWIRD